MTAIVDAPWIVTVLNGMPRKVYRSGHEPRARMLAEPVTTVPVVPVDDEAFERAVDAANDAYHQHNMDCGCHEVAHVTECVARAALTGAGRLS
jgi:hypothetical protein